MRIVFFIDHLRQDGAQRALKLLIDGLLVRGHSVSVVSMDDDGDNSFLADLQAASVEVRSIGRMPLVTGYGLLSIWLWLRSRRFDVAVTLLFIADVFGRPLARAAGIPRLISSIRARNIHYPYWKRIAVRLTMPLADIVVINSTTVRDFAEHVEGAPADRTICIRNGVVIETPHPASERLALRKELGIPAGHHLLGCVGRLTYQKGFDILLRAMTRTARNSSLLIVGRGEDEAKLRSLAMELGIADRVHFVGYRRDVSRILCALDMYIHPARFEGMPNALLEAMAAGCPIVATAVDGNRELITDGSNGWLVPPDDIPALTCAIEAALADPGEAHRRGAMARKSAIERFSVQAMVDQWEHVLRGNHG